MSVDEDVIVTMRRRGRRLITVTDEREQWLSRRGSVTAAPQPVGVITPPGLIWPNDYDLWDFNTTTDLSGVPDITAQTQAAINSIQATGQGGTVRLPPGVLRINGVTISGGGVRLEGAQWEDQSSSGRGLRGTFILTDNPAVSAITLAPTANLTALSNLAFIQVQPPDAPLWTPTSYLWSVTNNSAGAALFERLLFWGVDRGIKLGDASPCGPTTIRDSEFACFDNGIQVQSMADWLVIDSVAYRTSLLGSRRANQQIYASGNSGVSLGGNASFINVLSLTRGVITNISCGPCFSGVQFTATGNPRLRISDSDFQGCTQAIVELGTNAALRLSGLTVKGNPAVIPGLACNAITLEGTSPLVDLVDCALTGFGGYAIACVGTGADLRMGPNCWIDNWNLTPGVPGEPNPAPAMLANAGNTIRYSTITRFTNANGGPNTGGAGTFTTY